MTKKAELKMLTSRIEGVRVQLRADRKRISELRKKVEAADKKLISYLERKRQLEEDPESA